MDFVPRILKHFPSRVKFFTCAQGDIYKKVHSNIVYDREKVETTDINQQKHRYLDVDI